MDQQMGEPDRVADTAERRRPTTMTRAMGTYPLFSRPMTAKQRLEATLWDIANALRGKMSADDFRDYILGFIFFKYLSEKMEFYADEILHPDGITYDQITAKTKDREAYLKAVSDLSVEHLGYFLEPEELFKNIVPCGRERTKVDAPFILDKLTDVLRPHQRQHART
jgi:type I restriction enzyme M protein